MSRFGRIASHLRQLEELQAILSSMKTLAQLELHKLGKVTETQREMGRVLDRAVSDYLYFSPQPEDEIGNEVWLVIGSERGFCGSFNELLIDHLLQKLHGNSRELRVMAVGRKLAGRLGEKLPCREIAGAASGEELWTILPQVVEEVGGQLQRLHSTAFRVVFHHDERGMVVDRRLLPPERVEPPVKQQFPPLFLMESDRLFHDLLQQYLFLGLIRLFTFSLLAENRYRVQHLGGAVRRLDERLGLLRSRARSLRQEEITEEIEMILLGSGAFAKPGT